MDGQKNKAEIPFVDASRAMSYFPEMNPLAREKITRLGSLYAAWNEKLNLISRRDIEHFYERHVLHSLSIAFWFQFQPGERVLDMGTGGGFPGIPLAILFPETQFTLLDSISKKIKAVGEIARELDLPNVRVICQRAEAHHDQYHYITARAVTRLDAFVAFVGKNLLKQNTGRGGILYLKGGDWQEESQSLKAAIRCFSLSGKLDQEFFLTKKLIHIVPLLG